MGSKGYKILYLTARSITLSDTTRSYIESIQHGAYKMPLGPVVTTPNTVGHALARELIMGRSHEFKESILKQIRTLFGACPFVSGWGNRDADSLAYLNAGVDPHMI